MKSNNNHIHHKISVYLDGELSPEERDEFETHLAGCEECRQLIEPYKQIDALLNDFRQDRAEHLTTDETVRYYEGTLDPQRKRNIEEHLRSCSMCTKLLEAADVLDVGGKKLAAEIQPVTRTGFNFNNLFDFFFSRKLIPAGVAAGVIVVLIFFLVRPEMNPYAELIEITPTLYVPPALRGDGIQELFQTGMEHYIDGDFTSAAAVLHNIVYQEPDNPQYRFFYGITSLLNGEYREGIDQLKTDTVMNSVYRDEAMWYTAHAHLMMNNPEQAGELLRDLSVTSERFSAEADSLLHIIESVSR